MIASVVLKQKMILDHNSFEMLNKIDEFWVLNFYKFSSIEDESYSGKKAKIVLSTFGIISLFAAYKVTEKCFVFLKFCLYRYQVVLLDWLNWLCIWINGYNKAWENFVQKQVTQIRNNLPDIKWLHCPGTGNPADIPSGGLSLNRKNIFNLWINGPRFLYYSESEWGKFISYNNTSVKSLLIYEPTKMMHLVLKMCMWNQFAI